MPEGLDPNTHLPSISDAAEIDHSIGTSQRVPLCFVVDEETSIRHFLSLILQGAGIDTQEFADAAAMRQAIVGNNPDLIFLSVGSESSQAIDCLIALGKLRYFGFVQL